MTAALGIAHLQRHARRLAVENQELTQRLHALRHVARGRALVFHERQAADDKYQRLQQQYAELEADHAEVKTAHAALQADHAALQAAHAALQADQLQLAQNVGYPLQASNCKQGSAQWLSVETEVRWHIKTWWHARLNSLVGPD